QRVVIVQTFVLFNLHPHHTQRFGLKRDPFLLCALLYLLGFSNGRLVLAAIEPRDTEKYARVVFLKSAASAVKLAGFNTQFGVGNPGAPGEGASRLGRLDLLLSAEDFGAVFE